jgi:GT2 family glycosyltransferase
MSGSSRVAALVPTYNGAGHLRETLASLAAQDHPGLRILVSDDASTDATGAVCGAFRDDDRFRFLCQPHRLGWLGNSNALLAEVEVGDEYVFFAPHDDVFDPTYVRRMVEALELRPEAVMAFSDVAARGRDVVFPPLGREAPSGGRLRRGLCYLPEDVQERCLPFRGLVRAGAVRAVGPLRSSVVGEFDADGRWLFRLALLGPFVRIPERLCVKRLHPGSLASSWRYTRTTWSLDAITYVAESGRARLPPLELVVMATAAIAQAIVALLPRSWRRAIGRFRRASSV